MPSSYTGEKLANQAKIGIVQARAVAAHPGTIIDEELEWEKGGSGLRYSFDIKRGPKTQEVGIDARTGKVLEIKKDHTPTKQAFCQARAESWLLKPLVSCATFIAIGSSRSPLTR
jgi:Peptidase propeptide and YPEB domain